MKKNAIRTFMILFVCLTVQRTMYAIDEKVTIMSPGSIILYVIDGKWADHTDCYCYTKTPGEKTEVTLDPGIHTFEFKYPKNGFNGKVFSAKFKAEAGKTYLIKGSDTKKDFPEIVDETNKKVPIEAEIKMITAIKTDAKSTALPGIDKNNSATLTGTCCNGYYDKKGNANNISNIVYIFRIDSVWGPYANILSMSYNNQIDGRYLIELSPGMHTFYYVVIPSSGLYDSNISTNEKYKMDETDQFINRKVFSSEGNFEAGKTYGFDFKIRFDDELAGGNFTYDLKVTEAPDASSGTK